MLLRVAVASGQMGGTLQQSAATHPKTSHELQGVVRAVGAVCGDGLIVVGPQGRQQRQPHAGVQPMFSGQENPRRLEVKARLPDSCNSAAQRQRQL
jgi:hypothetical protein